MGGLPSGGARPLYWGGRDDVPWEEYTPSIFLVFIGDSIYYSPTCLLRILRGGVSRLLGREQTAEGGGC